MTLPFCGRREIGRGTARHALAHKEAKAELLSCGSLDILQVAEPHLHFGRAIADIKNVGGIGAGLAGGLDQGGGARLGVFHVKHRRRLRAARRKSKVRSYPLPGRRGTSAGRRTGSSETWRARRRSEVRGLGKSVSVRVDLGGRR